MLKENVRVGFPDSELQNETATMGNIFPRPTWLYAQALACRAAPMVIAGDGIIHYENYLNIDFDESINCLSHKANHSKP